MILSMIEKYEIKLTAPYICMALFYYPKGDDYVNNQEQEHITVRRQHSK